MRQERPTRPRSTEIVSIILVCLKCILVNSPGEEVIVLLLFRFIFSFMRSVREYRAHLNGLLCIVDIYSGGVAQ